MSEQIGTACLILALTVVVIIQTFSTWASGALGYVLSGALLVFGFALLALLNKSPDVH